MARRIGFAAFLEQAGVALDTAFSHGHIEYLFQVPPQMIENRNDKPAFALASSRFCSSCRLRLGSSRSPNVETRWKETLLTLFFHFLV